MKNDAASRAASPKKSMADKPTRVILKAPALSTNDKKRLKALRDWEKESEMSLLGYRARA